MIYGLLLFILSALTAFADVAFHNLVNSLPLFFLKTVSYFLFYLLFFFLAEKFYQWSLRKTPNIKLGKFFSYTPENIFRIALVLIGIYLIYLIIYYPGTCGYDTINQIDDLLTGMEPRPFNWVGDIQIKALMNDHHPVFTTLVFTAFYKIGSALGNPDLGMFLFCLVQMTALSFLISFIICSMEKFGIPPIIALISTILYAMPFTAYYAITMIKDSLFSVVFLAFYLFYIFLFMDLIDGRTSTKRKWIGLFLFSILIALCNKKGMYIAFASNLLLLLKSRGKRGKMLALCSSLVPLLVITVLLGKIIFPLANIYPGGPQEGLGFAFQQTAKARIDYPDDFTQEDNQVFFHVLQIKPEELPQKFRQDTSDSIKDSYNYYATSKDRSAFLKIWIKMGIRHPVLYARTTLSICGGYFAPIKSINVYDRAAYRDSLKAFKNPDSRLSAREQVLQWFTWLETCPPLTFLFCDAFYMWWLPLTIVVLLFRHKTRWQILMLAPIAANILFLILGPVCWTRYGLCQIYTIPLQLEVLYLKNKKKGAVPGSECDTGVLPVKWTMKFNKI